MKLQREMKFSVLMPVYIKDDATYLDLALRSITTDQLLKPDEIVIVEDGPVSEEVNAVLTKFESAYPIIHRFRLKENMGMGKAMNYGLSNTRFEWVARMDSDDIARPDRFEKQMRYLEAHPDISILGASMEEFDHVPGDKGIKRALPENHEDIMKMMRMRNPLNHMTIVYQRDMAVKAGGYWDHRYFEDYNLWYEMSRAGGRFHNLSENLVDVRVGNNMVARRAGLNYFKDEKRLLNKFLKDGFIPVHTYVLLLTVKLTLRILPVSLLRLFYKYFLRKST